VLPQLLLLGHDGMALLLLFIYAGADLYMVSMFFEPHSGHGMFFSVFSAIVAFMLDSTLHFAQRRS
jgi:hypothetical protein